MVGGQQSRRVRDLAHSRLTHLEQADLVGGAKAVLETAKNSQAAIEITFEVENDIDRVLEQFGPGDASVLGHVADEHHRHSRLLGGVNQAGRALPDLGDPTGGTAHLPGLDRLHRVDDQQVGLDIGRGGNDRVDIAFRGEQHAVAHDPEASRPEPDLVERLLGAGDQHLALLRRQRSRHLEQQRRLAYSRLATDEDGGTGDQPAAEHAIDLSDADRPAHDVARTGGADGYHPRLAPPPGRGAALGGDLHQGTVGAALRAESHPLEALVSADLTAVLHATRLSAPYDEKHRHGDRAQQEQTPDEAGSGPELSGANFGKHQRAVSISRGQFGIRGTIPVRMDDDSIDSFDDLFEPFGLEGKPDKEPAAQRRQSAPRSSRSPSPVEGAVACGSCGAPNDPDNRHCERCGARLARSQMPVAPQPMLRTTAGARALIVLASVVLGVAILALVVNLLSSGGGGTNETTTTTPTSLATTPIGPITPIRVNCTSELTSFPCDALIDGNPATSWNATDGGVGVEITFLFAPPVQITEMIIQNVEDECRFLRNARIDGIEVSIDDLTQTIVKNLDDSREPQRIGIRSIETTRLTIRITSGYPGQTCDNKEPFPEMAAQDIEFFGRPTPGG
jgi:hypothetical protein